MTASDAQWLVGALVFVAGGLGVVGIAMIFDAATDDSKDVKGGVSVVTLAAGLILAALAVYGYE